MWQPVCHFFSHRQIPYGNWQQADVDVLRHLDYYVIESRFMLGFQFCPEENA